MLWVSKRNLLSKDDTDGISYNKFGDLLLNKKDVINKSDLAGGIVALVDSSRKKKK